MKAKTLLVAAVMFLALSAAAFAQATFQVGSIPVTAVTATGMTEGTGAITFSIVSGATGINGQGGTISISYGSNVIITSDFSTVQIGGSLTGCVTTGVACTTQPTVNATASTYNPGVLVLNIPNGATGGAFTVSNLRVAVSGTGLTSLNASISSVNNAILAGQTVVTVISSIANGLNKVDSDAVTVIGTSRTGGTGNLYVYENYLNAFNDSTYGNLGFPLWIRFTLSGLPPAGVTITFPMTADTFDANTDAATSGVFKATDPTDGGDAAAAPSFTSTSSSLVMYYRVSSSTSASNLEYLQIPFTVTVATDAALPLPAAAITFTATLAPIGNALDANGHPIPPAATDAPRFSVLEVGPKNVLAITGSNTSMLVPFASVVSSSGYDTGIAIANATLDKGKTALGITKAAVPQAGTILFWFYPQTSGTTAVTPFSYTTSAGSPGTGLDASGKLQAGSTYSVLLSQLLAAAQAPADFSGHIYIITGFTNAHCQYILTDFKAFANGGQALILPLDRTQREMLSH